MKNTLSLSLLLLFVSSSAFAQTSERLLVQVLDLDRTDSSIAIYCQDEPCESLRIVRNSSATDHAETLLTLAQIHARAERKLKREYEKNAYRPYFLTQNTLARANTLWTHGLKTQAILKYLLAIGTTAVDTAALPVAGVTHYSESSRPYASDRKDSRRLLSLIEEERREIFLTHNRFLKLYYSIH